MTKGRVKVSVSANVHDSVSENVSGGKGGLKKEFTVGMYYKYIN